jgi:hypothetical protein
MTSTTLLQHELEKLDAKYAEAFARADACLRTRRVLLAALYLKDLLRIGFSAAGTAALLVPVLWFWGVVSDMGAAQQAMAAPIDSAAVWQTARALFVVSFAIMLGLALFRGQLGRSRTARTHADAQLLYAHAAGHTGTCPQCGRDSQAQ